MAKKEILGLIGPCYCGFPDAEVRNDKNDHPYVYCPDCSGQWLTHGRAERVRPMLARMRPVVAKGPAPAAPGDDAKEQAPVPGPSKPPAPEKQKSFATLLG